MPKFVRIEPIIKQHIENAEQNLAGDGSAFNAPVKPKQLTAALSELQEAQLLITNEIQAIHALLDYANLTGKTRQTVLPLASSAAIYIHEAEITLLDESTDYRVIVGNVHRAIHSLTESVILLNHEISNLENLLSGFSPSSENDLEEELPF